MPQKHLPEEPSLLEMSVCPEKIRRRDKLISDAEELYGKELDNVDHEILHTAPADLVEVSKQPDPKYTCQRVMQAYIKAACISQKTHNVLTEILFVQAMEDARQKDKERAAGMPCEGAFWGLPSSFKDTYNIVGVDSSLGCSPHCDIPVKDPNDESALVRLFRKGGGIPFCKTNVPQTLLAFESSNPVFGPSCNPIDSTRVPGGSSGGEAALVALRSTPVGWGSDIGGSLRIPAHYSGICGLKPVKGRWPVGPGRKTVPGFEGIVASVGPMARNVDDLEWASRSMTDLVMEHSDRGGEPLVPIPWRNVELPAKLSVGWFTEFGGVRTSPACERAVKMTIDALRNAGHRVEEFTPPNPLDSLKTFVALTSSDGYKSLMDNLGKDPMEPSMRLVTLGSRIPSFIKWIGVWIARNIVGDSTFASTLELSGRKTVSEFWKWTDHRNTFAEKFRQLAWGEKGYDMIICPVQATPALRHGDTEYLSPLAIATIMFNVCDSTVGVLPVTRVTDDDVVEDTDYPDHLPSLSPILEKRVYGNGGVYNASAMKGLPVGVQVVGRAYEEEKVLKMMKVVEDLVRFQT